MKIGLIIALEDEINQLLNKDLKLIDIIYDKYKIYLYEINNNQLYVALSGIGEINSSMATQYVIDKFNVDLIVNYGVCGSLKEEIGLLHVVMIESLIDGDYDTSKCGNELPFIRYEDGYNSLKISCNNEYTTKVHNLFPSIKGATCLSKNTFVDSLDEKRKLADYFKADICEMEALGIFLCSKKNGLPSLFIKGVSDSFNGGKEEYQAMKVEASKVIVEIILGLFKTL